jgi:hypothetical protein
MNGAHAFIPVLDASRIQEFGRIIDDRLWLAGHGSIKITGAGLMLDATILDRSVLSPERLCFVRATCEDGVKQNFPPFAFHPGEFDDVLGEERRRFEAVPAGEFLCGDQLRWLVRGLLPDAALGVLYGASGSAKSFLALDIAAAVALGRTWNSLPTIQGDVVYLCAEGARGFGKRIEAYCKFHEVDFGSSLRVIGDQPDLLTSSDIDLLLAELQHAKPALLIIDTLAQVMPGGDENSGVDIGKVLKVCRRFHEQLGCMVLLVHHAGKDLSKGARGWSGLRAAADVEILVAKATMGNVARQLDE